MILAAAQNNADQNIMPTQLIKMTVIEYPLPIPSKAWDNKEFNLSEKIWDDNNDRHDDCLLIKDVKEFIKRLKDLGGSEQLPEVILEKIDKLAGDKLI